VSDGIWIENKGMGTLMEDFAAPGCEFRGKPFWAWNGELSPDELRRQLRVMKQMGLGGGFMHSRVGLGTAYLSKEWFNCVHACIKECKALGMEAWLYDEDRWPSGAAGGLVTRNPKYRMHRLVLRQHTSARAFAWEKNTIAAFMAHVEGNTARDLKRLKQGTRVKALADGACILEFRNEAMPCTSWYNGYTYLDTMDREAVGEFIKVTHEAYRRECGEDFAKTVPGIFTDEPNYGHGFEDQGYLGSSAPWTRRFRKIFRERYGYDIVPHFPEVFFDIEGIEFHKARYHFFDCATHLFVDAFSRQIGEWCDSNGLNHTGHVLMEDTLSQQRDAVGSAMRFYEYMQAPGMDLLTEKWRIYDAAKQVSSVARQFDRKWRLTETYGCTGWDFSLAGHKALGDWQIALGINLRCQHLSWYTMAGQAKRDYPAGIFDHSPWWDAYHHVEDYFARVLAVMTRGREVRDLLVIHPIETAWAMGAADAPAYDQMLIDLRDTLLRANIDFDYGDEDIMARHCSVRRTDEGPRLRLGKADYTTVLLPPLTTIRGTTLNLLARFAKAGGKVILAGDPPAFVDGESSERGPRFAAMCGKAPAKGARLAKAVVDCRRVSIADEKGREIDSALYLLREDKENAYLFVCNTGHSSAQFRAPLSLDVFVRDRRASFDKVAISGLDGFAGHPIEYDPNTAATFAADAERVDGKWCLNTSLPVLGSRLYVIPRRKQRRQPPVRARGAIKQTRTLAGTWEYELTESNVFLLDHAAYKVGQGRWQRAKHILMADFAIRDALAIPRRGGAMVQPWARNRRNDETTIPVSLLYAFTVCHRPSRELWIALEQPERWRILLNGFEVSSEEDAGWWVDQSCRKLPIKAAMLKLGENTLEMTCDYNADGPDLEHVYVLGDFGVRTANHRPTMVLLPNQLRCGDWGKQGLAFYSGSITYRRSVKVPVLGKGERLLLHVPHYKGSVVRVWEGGREVGLIAWEPNEMDMTDYLNDGILDLGIEVISHRRNSHGPLHLENRWPEWHGPDQFVYAHGDSPRYYTVPCGLTKPPHLTIRAG